MEILQGYLFVRVYFYRWLCRISNKIDVKAFDLILERQRSDPGPVKCFSDDEVIRLCTQMLESDQVSSTGENSRIALYIISIHQFKKDGDPKLVVLTARNCLRGKFFLCYVTCAQN